MKRFTETAVNVYSRKYNKDSMRKCYDEWCRVMLLPKANKSAEIDADTFVEIFDTFQSADLLADLPEASEMHYDEWSVQGTYDPESAILMYPREFVGTWAIINGETDNVDYFKPEWKGFAAAALNDLFEEDEYMIPSKVYTAPSNELLASISVPNPKYQRYVSKMIAKGNAAVSARQESDCGLDTWGKYTTPEPLVQYPDVEKVVIPEGTTEIEDRVFRNHNNLREIVIPDTVTRIGKLAFNGCQNLTSIVLPENLVEIGESAFEFSGLKEVVIPDSVKEIGNGAFRSCKQLETVVLPTSIRDIQMYTFEHCEKLKDIVIPEGVTSISPCAFSYCENLETVVLPQSLTHIYATAFGYCHNLENIEIPEAVEYLSYQAFSGCDNIENKPGFEPRG